MKKNLLLVVSLSVCAVITVIAISSVLSLSRVRALEKEACAQEKHTDEQKDWVAVTNLYALFVSKLVTPNDPFYDEYQQPFPRVEGATGYTVETDDHMGETVSAETEGQFCFWFNRDTLVPFRIHNTRLIDYVNTNAVQNVPELSMTEAVKTAKHYLELLGIPLKSNMVLSSCSFNDSHTKHSWSITWVPTAGGYPYDTADPVHIQFLSVTFNEKYGFLGFYMQDDWPPPKSTEVRITREEALEKAEQVTSLMLTNGQPTYKMRTLEEIALRVYLSHWTLDPENERPSPETRLCWMVHFVRVDIRTGKTGTGMPGTNPYYLWIYVDAATGEIVGANGT